MCEFCEDIVEYDGRTDLETTDVFPNREKLILVNEEGKIRFYAFNRHHYEYDSCYHNIDVEFCPVCGRKLKGD